MGVKELSQLLIVTVSRKESISLDMLNLPISGKLNGIHTSLITSD